VASALGPDAADALPEPDADADADTDTGLDLGDLL
jgi:hypothetical protein